MEKERKFRLPIITRPMQMMQIAAMENRQEFQRMYYDGNDLLCIYHHGRDGFYITYRLPSSMLSSMPRKAMAFKCNNSCYVDQTDMTDAEVLEFISNIETKFQSPRKMWDTKISPMDDISRMMRVLHYSKYPIYLEKKYNRFNKVYDCADFYWFISDDTRLNVFLSHKGRK